MLRSRHLLTLVVATAAALGAAGPAAAQSVVSTPSDKTLYRTGNSGRFLMDGPWLYRADPGGTGDRELFQRQTTTAGWSLTAVPNTWNATDESDASFMGGVGWYRKDFRLPRGARSASWVVRFESVNYRSRVWLNGRPIGSNRGAYLPFEIRLPRSALRRGLVNRLVVRVDSRRKQTDFPPSGLSVTGRPTGGWWNYGGLLREVYLRRIDDVDVTTAVVRPDLPCALCPATVDYRVVLRNYGERARRVRVTARFGARRVSLGGRVVAARQFSTFTRRINVPRPRLWSPATPNLYDATVSVRSGRRTLQRYVVETGVRSIRVAPDGRMLLNGAPLNFRGVAIHEDSKDKGFAIGNAERDQTLAWMKELGATMVRSHYPLHPYFQEQADRLGIMQWSEIPVYSVKTPYLKQPLVRRLAARELESNILTNGNHPSVMVWSMGNELSARPGPVQGYYIRRAAASANRLDPTRPVGLAVAGYPGVGCQSEYEPLDVIGVNEYFGWYPGPNGQIADRTALSEYLDSVRACYPRKAVVISEFGAEANREGPVEEKGTYLYQQDFVNYHLGVYATKPWLSGAIYWTLQEFRVRPNWEGGNPRPSSPLHQKAVIGFDGARKPAFGDLQRGFQATRQLGARR
jgi:beta-galactosidase/beta-glucuronidase